MATWKNIKFREVLEIISGFAFKSGDFIEAGIPVLKISNIKIGKADFQESNTQFISVEQSKSVADKYKINKGNILVSLTGSHITQPNSVVGRVARYQYDYEALLNQRTAKIIAKENFDSLFVYYCLLSQKIRIMIAMQAQGEPIRQT